MYHFSHLFAAINERYAYRVGNFFKCHIMTHFVNLIAFKNAIPRPPFYFCIFKRCNFTTNRCKKSIQIPVPGIEPDVSHYKGLWTVLSFTILAATGRHHSELHRDWKNFFSRFQQKRFVIDRFVEKEIEKKLIQSKRYATDAFWNPKVSIQKVLLASSVPKFLLDYI